MNSRERVRMVLDKRIPDKVPCGLGGCETAGLHLQAYDKLQEVLKVPRTKPRLDTFMMNAVFEMDVIEALGADIVLLASPRMCRSRFRGPGNEGEWKEQALWGRTFRVPVSEIFTNNPDGSMIWETAGKTTCLPGGMFFNHIPSESEAGLKLDYEIPSPKTYNPAHELPERTLMDLEEAARELFLNTDKSICCGETITDLQIGPCGFTGTMMLMMERPELMHEYLDKSVSSALSQLKQLDQVIGKYADMLSIAHDFGDNRNVMIGAPLWREIYKPHYKRLFTEWKKITRMKINFHSCGAISEILPDLVECGVDVLNPVQTSADNMDAPTLKNKFGDDLVFFGGAYDAQSIPANLSYEEVYVTVKRNCEIFKKGGGFIFAGVHNLPGDIPEHHIEAMLEAFNESKNY
ncbi:MAG: uroporphyrinogen decarboxylase family protein [Victivallales bacterium]